MPATAVQSRNRPPRFAAAAVLLAGLAAVVPAQGPPVADQKKSTDAAAKADAGAFRLPDGTVVFVTKTPDDPDPKIDGVWLSPKEYQALLDKADQLRRAREAARPVAPSECHVRGRVEAKRDRPVAALRLTYAFRTVTPRAVVALGCQRAFPAAAADGGRKLPLLESSDAGLTVLVEDPGPHTLTLDLDVPVGPRGGKGEVGFEFGLPRAAITTLALEPPGPEVKRLTVTTQTPEPGPAPARAGEVKRATEDAARIAPKPGENGLPLGPIESLQVTWETPATAAPAAAETPVTVEAEVAVRVEAVQVETTARLRLRGPARDWAFSFPPGANVAVERAGGPAPAAGRGPTITRPADPRAADGWVIQTPDAGEWVATVTARQPRPEPKAGKDPAPYPVGPFFAPGVPRQTGTVRVFAPVTVHPGFRAPREVRRQDAPAGGGEDAPVLVFRYATPPLRDDRPAPLLELDLRPAHGSVQVEPVHRLRLTEGGWRLRSEVRVTPIRTEVDQVVVRLPAGWQTPDVLPPELVEEVRPGPDGQFAVRLAAPQKGPFGLVLEAAWPVPPAAREAVIPLPRFPAAAERGARVTAGVPDGFEVRGTAREWDGRQAVGFPTELVPPTPPAGGAAVTAVAGRFDAGAARVDLAWQPYRPPLAADVRADVTLYERQAEVHQTVRLSAPDGLPRAVRFKGPPAAAGFQARALDPAGPGEWVFAPRAGAGEAEVTMRYAVPLPAAGGRLAVPLVWPDATRVDAGVRVWARGGHRVAGFDGPWRERPPEPDKAQYDLPALTLAGGGPGLPLSLDLAVSADGSAPVVIARAAVQAWAADDGTTQVRGRYVLTRWPAAGVEVELPVATEATVVVDRKQVWPAAVGEAAGGRVIRVPLPEPRADRPAAELEVRYVRPPTRAGLGELTVVPPAVRGAAVLTPVRWQLVVPASAVPLVPDPGFVPEARWQWRGWMFAPAPAASPDDLDGWLAGGADPGGADEPAAWAPPRGEVVAGRLPAAARLRVVRVPRVVCVIGCSVLVFVAGIVVSRLRPRLLGPAVAALGAAAAAAAVTFPQPAGQVAAAAQPGVVVLALAFAAQAARRWYHRRRLTHLPTFARGSTVDRPTGAVTGPGLPARSSRNGAATDGARSGSSIPPLTPAGKD